MRTRQASSRFLILLIVVVVLLAGIVGGYRRFINPKYLKVKGVNVPTVDVMQAYYQMNPGVSRRIKVSRQNAIEAFLLKQELYRTYLAKTQDQWFEGRVLDQKEGYTTEDLSDTEQDRAVRRYLLDTGQDILCVYTSNPAWRFPVGQRIRVRLGVEFTMLSTLYRVVRESQTIDVRFASAIVEVKR